MNFMLKIGVGEKIRAGPGRAGPKNFEFGPGHGPFPSRAKA